MHRPAAQEPLLGSHVDPDWVQVRPRTALHIWRKVGLGVLRSSLFLSGYCTLAWVGVCAGMLMAGSWQAHGHRVHGQVGVSGLSQPVVSDACTM